MQPSELIRRSLRLLGVLAEGEIPSAETADDAFSELTDLLAAWSADGLSPDSMVSFVYTWPSSTNLTIGTGGAHFNEVCFSQVAEIATVGLSGGIGQIHLIDYPSFSLLDKNEVGDPTHGTVVFLEAVTQINLWPIPKPGTTVSVCGVKQFSVQDLNSTVQLPPLWEGALVKHLALNIAPYFGIQPSAELQRSAMVSKRRLERLVTSQPPILKMPPGVA